jgi:hypothetical protein
MFGALITWDATTTRWLIGGIAALILKVLHSLNRAYRKQIVSELELSSLKKDMKAVLETLKVVQTTTSVAATHSRNTDFAVNQIPPGKDRLYTKVEKMDEKLDEVMAEQGRVKQELASHGEAIVEDAKARNVLNDHLIQHLLHHDAMGDK